MEDNIERWRRRLLAGDAAHGVRAGPPSAWSLRASVEFAERFSGHACGRDDEEGMRAFAEAMYPLAEANAGRLRRELRRRILRGGTAADKWDEIIRNF